MREAWPPGLIDQPSSVKVLQVGSCGPVRSFLCQITTPSSPAQIHSSASDPLC